MTAAWRDPRIVSGMTAQLAMRRARLEFGEVPLGWKVGFGAPAAKEKLKLTAPLVGFLMERGRLNSGATVSLKNWAKPVAEPEIAVYLGRDVEPGGTLADAADAIAALGPAIELADANLPFDDAEAILKGNIFQRHVLLGERDASRAGGKVSGLVGSVHRRGAEVARTDAPEAATGSLVDIVRHVADLLPHFGERLRAGEVIIAGSIVPPIFIEADDGEVLFHLDPVGSVSVRIAKPI